ncbi:MAG TPA: hypothetical protein VNP73_04840, partial [Actinomycetota bacterium]|nr:hypothetical protein [Actinomycetota bacterium]
SPGTALSPNTERLDVRCKTNVRRVDQIGMRAYIAQPFVQVDITLSLNFRVTGRETGVDLGRCKSE